MDDAHASKIYSPVRDLAGGMKQHATVTKRPPCTAQARAAGSRRLADPLEGS